MITKVKKQLKFADVTIERVHTKKRNIKRTVPDKVVIEPTLKKCKVVLDSIKIDEFLTEKKININLSKQFLEIIKKSPVVRLNKPVPVLKPVKVKKLKKFVQNSIGARLFDERCNFFPEPGPSNVNYYETIRIPAWEIVDKNQSTDSIDLGFQSFYDKSVFNTTADSEHGSFHLELSDSDCSMDSEKLSGAGGGGSSACDTSCFVITPKLNPPTFNEVKNSLKLFNIPEIETKTLFYGNPKDLNGKRNTILRIRSSNCFEDFKSSVPDLIGLNDWRRSTVSKMLGISIEKRQEIKPEVPLIISDDVFNEDDNEDELIDENLFKLTNEQTEERITSSQINLSDNNAIREFLSTEEHLIICPLKAPPSQNSARIWLKQKAKVRVNRNVLNKKTPPKKVVKKINIKRVTEIIQIDDDDDDEVENSLPCGQLSNPSSNSNQSVIISKTMLEETIKDSNNSCNISGAALNNTYGFKMDFENLQNAKANSKVFYLFFSMHFS